MQTFKRRDRDKRDTDSVIIDEIAMRSFAVASQSLPVVADKNEDRILVQAILLQPGDTPSDLFIHESDLTVVEADEAPGAEFRAIRLRRFIGSMRVVKMNPGEKRVVLLALQPVQSGIHHQVARPLNSAEVEMFIFFQVELVIIVLKPLIEPPAAVQDKGADKSSALIALR